MANPTAPTLIFDLGGVLIDWNPRYLYGKLFRGDAPAMESFLAEICSPAWNLGLDAGRPFAEAIAELVERHPDHRPMIELYWARWPEMLRGPIHDTVVTLERLSDAGIPLYALSNWARETFELVKPLPEYAFLKRFERIFLSGEMGLAKPDPEIFRVMLSDLGRQAEACLFIDDNPDNIAAADALGIVTHHFRDPAELRRDLAGRGFPV